MQSIISPQSAPCARLATQNSAVPTGLTFGAMRGFSLVELLVAVVIGLLGSLAIMEIYVSTEAGKRATGSLADSQSAGAVALYSLERDLQQAGQSFMNLAALGCNVLSSFPFNSKPLQPLTIIPASSTAANNLWDIPDGDAGSDMIAIAYGDSSSIVEGAMIAVTHAVNATQYRLSSIYGINSTATGDYLLLAEANKDCTLTRATATDAVNSLVTVDYAGQAEYSPAAVALHLGQAPRIVVYAVRNGALTRCDFLANDCSDAGAVNDPTVWEPVANDVVALVAQYGFDTDAPMDMVVDAACKSRLDHASPNCPVPDAGATAPGNLSLTQPQRACDWARIPYVQLAIVTRSGQYEKEEVSPATIKLWPDSAVAPTTVGPVWNVPDRHYRYRVTRSAASLRNVLWMGVQSSC